MSFARYSEAELETAIEALSDRERFAEAEALVAAAAPRLQRVLVEALEHGGWFAESHDAEVRKLASDPDPEARATGIRVLLAEEARMGMMVGVAVGWALSEQLAGRGSAAAGEE